MSVSSTFNEKSSNQAAPEPRKKVRRKRPAPFSVRLSDDERARLADEAKGVPLGAYIKAKALGGPAIRLRRTGLGVEDRKSLAQALALLGQSRLASNLNQLAHAANIGVLPLTPETEAEMLAALRDVREIRRLLLVALGLKGEASSCS